MSISGAGGLSSGRPIDELAEAPAAAPAPASAAAPRAAAGAPPQAAAGSALREVYGRWERALNKLSDLFGGDRALEQLSEKITRAKEKAFSDRTLTRTEMESLRAETALITRAYAELATARGYPPGAVRPASRDGFSILEENQEIHFQWLAGTDLRGGALAELVKAASRRGGDVAAITKKIAFDIATSPDAAVATDKVRLLRAQLSLVPDRAAQEAALGRVRAAIAETQRALGTEGALPLAAFDRAAWPEPPVATAKETPLPAEVAGSNKLFPNRPIAGWEATTRAATKAAIDDMEAAGKLFLSKIPPGSPPKTVAVKLDLNLGADGPPSVSDPTTTGATLSELLERAARDKKEIRLTVGDSAGGENIPLGRKTMDIMRDTGNYHHALKAGLRFAAGRGSAEAQAALAKIEDAERRGVYFGSKDDRVSTAADLRAAEAAAKPYVTCVDYDDAGYAPVDPQLGPLGQAAWGTREFRIAKPWVEADFRVHVARGASTHLLAGWTGATKGLIGLHAFGLRPVDQGMNKLGQDALGAFALLSQAAAFGAIFESRTGVKDVLAKIATSGDDGLVRELREVEATWNGLKGNVAAWKTFSKGARDLAAELERDRAAGMSEADIAAKMRTRTREILDRADAQVPGFKQAMWDATHAATRVMMVAARNFRGLIPDAIKDEQAGARIGLLTSLPYPSDLVIQSQPKIGIGGGPDAYKDVKDVGVIIAATDEATADAMAWKAAGRTDNLWEKNYPVHAGLRYGRGPMHHDEIRVVGAGRQGGGG